MPETNVDFEALAKLLRVYADMLDNDSNSTLMEKAELVRELYRVVSSANRNLVIELLREGEEEFERKLKELDSAVKKLDDKVREWEEVLKFGVALRGEDHISGPDGVVSN